jgi:hypothetical protein
MDLNDAKKTLLVLPRKNAVVILEQFSIQPLCVVEATKQNKSKLLFCE